MSEKKEIEKLAEFLGVNLEEAKLTYQQRKRLPKKTFVFPKKAPGGGSYPIPDRAHAKNALARVSAHGTPAEKAAVKRRVCAKYPDFPICKGTRKMKASVGQLLREKYEKT